MAGRIARLRRLKCTHFDAAYVLTVDFMEIWLLGHSFCSIYNAWARMPLHDTYYRAGLLALTHLKRSGFKKLSAQKVSMVRGSASSSLAPTRFCICGCEKEFGRPKTFPHYTVMNVLVFSDPAPLLDDECAVEAAADFLNLAKADHSKVMLSDAMVRHICNHLSVGMIEKIAGKLPYKIAKGINVISWSNLWKDLFPVRNRVQWIKYIKNLGVPESAIDIAGVSGKAAASSLVLGGLIYAGSIPPHRLVNVLPKVPNAVYTQEWPAA